MKNADRGREDMNSNRRKLFKGVGAYKLGLATTNGCTNSSGSTLGKRFIVCGSQDELLSGHTNLKNTIKVKKIVAFASHWVLVTVKLVFRFVISLAERNHEKRP